MIPFLLITVGLVAYIITRTVKAPIPQNDWKLFNAPGAVYLEPEVLEKIEGVYIIKEGNEDFGSTVVVKWSRINEGDKQIHHISFFFDNTSYFIFRCKKFRNRILLSGYWSSVIEYKTGKARFIIDALGGAEYLLSNNNSNSPYIIKGKYGFNEKYPTNSMTLIFDRALKKTSYHIIGHRGGGRNVDFLHTSENSLEMLKMTPLLGATGVEIDVNLTSDKVPVLFHDDILTEQTIQDYYGVSMITDHTLDELKKKRLKKGEQIPTLREALDTILYCTRLELVWLDIKFNDDLTTVHDLQNEYLLKAKEAGRNMEIYIGVPDEDTVIQIMKLRDYKNIPSLVELGTEEVDLIDANVWAPKWTDGLKIDEIRKLRTGGRKTFVWTVNASEVIERFIEEGNYDGMLSNYPSVVAHYVYSSNATEPLNKSTKEKESMEL